MGGRYTGSASSRGGRRAGRRATSAGGESIDTWDEDIFFVRGQVDRIVQWRWFSVNKAFGFVPPDAYGGLRFPFS